ncbi:hypothetical protein Hanom_Chr08g00703361 [Helianthus anomalus]
MVWQVIFQWWRVPYFYMFHVWDLLTMREELGGSRARRKTILALVYIVMWSLWRSRNEAVFGEKTP